MSARRWPALIKRMGPCPTCGSDNYEPCTYPISEPLSERRLIPPWEVHRRRPEFDREAAKRKPRPIMHRKRWRISPVKRRRGEK